MRQLIIARKDLKMSPGKLAAQVSHASMAFLAAQIKENISKYDNSSFPVYGVGNEPCDRDGVILYRNPDLYRFAKEAASKGETVFYCRRVDPSVPYGPLELCDPDPQYYSSIHLDKETFEEWFDGNFTKTICEAKNLNHLMKAVKLAEELGMREGQDFFFIKDICLTELTPEEIDENGQGKVLTCIGFRPLPDDIARSISGKFQLYRD